MPSSPLGSLRGTVAVAALGLLLSSSLALGAASNRELEDRANAMEARLHAVERSSKALVELQQQIEAGLLDGGVARCHATTRKGKACQRTPLPGRDYCPSHQHLEHSANVAA